MSAVGRLRARLERLAGWSRSVDAWIAGEHFTVDSSTGLSGPVNDYDYNWLRILATGKSCILDIGSNIGVTALLFARHMQSQGVCVLVDMLLDNLSLASKNLSRSALLEHAVFIRARIGDHDAVSSDGTAIMASRQQLKRAARERAILDRGERGASSTIDTICSRFEFEPDLIKIDIEGAEHHALLGARNTIARFLPQIQVEMHSFPPMTMLQNATQVLGWCHQSGYRAWYLATGVPIGSPR